MPRRPLPTAHNLADPPAAPTSAVAFLHAYTFCPVRSPNLVFDLATRRVLLPLCFVFRDDLGHRDKSETAESSRRHGRGYSAILDSRIFPKKRGGNRTGGTRRKISIARRGRSGEREVFEERASSASVDVEYRVPGTVMVFREIASHRLPCPTIRCSNRRNGRDARSNEIIRIFRPYKHY